ncbi:hypothetical protein IT571_04175, partial [Candidatus Sumerlaeota bacterium]|nr:hypothetical protein [Candidatus Sumerlaeota bacterium]
MSAAAPPFLERAREAVKSSSRAPLWALLFESLVRGITGMVLIALLYIVAVTIWHGAPRLDWEFISQPPRDAMMKGGVFPAIFGTVFVVLFMIIMALPLGVFGAVYMVEYAKGGLFARITRAAVNNLAGVPSIVFGLFGLGFFVLFIGRNLDYYVYDIPRNEAET